MSDEKSTSAKGDKKSGKKPFAALGNFWRKHILRKKAPEETPSSSSGSSNTMTAEEKNKLAAETAASGLRLDDKAREHVAKALANEMQRRHMEREKRRKELMASTRAQLPWDKKMPTKVAKAGKASKTPASPGSSVFPIKMVPKKKGASAPASKGLDSGTSADIEEEWHPVPATAGGGSTSASLSAGNNPPAPASSPGLSLEDQRKKWLEKHGPPKSQPVAYKAPATSSQMLAGPPTVSARAAESQSDAFGSQPTELQIDDATAQEIHSHTFEKIIENMLVQAKGTQGKETSTKAKDPQDMTPDELAELLRRNPDAWDQFTKQNTVISFGMAAPTDDDKNKGSKTKSNRRASVIKFESQVDVASVPVGKDFNFNEKKVITTASLKK